MNKTASRLVREPLVHFLLGGLLIFAFFVWRGTPVDPSERNLDISRAQQAQISLQFERMMQRPPTDAELGAAIERWIREEILYREGLRLGLDQNDTVVRKRMTQKMDFIAASAAETAQPTEKELQAWLETHPARFTPDTRFGFDQLWFAQADDAEQAKARLAQSSDWQGQGEKISLPPSVSQTTRSQISAQFGEKFTQQIDTLAPGPDWQGPIRSGFGFHLVRLEERKMGTLPQLQPIRKRVEDDWRGQTMIDRRDKAYRLLREAYSISVER